MKRFFLIYFFFIFIVSCNNTALTGNVQKEFAVPVENNNYSIDIFFCPRDECDLKLNEALNSASKSINCAFYNLNLDNIIETIKNKENYIDVKVVADDNAIKKLKRFNIKNLKYDTDKALMHNKFCIIDGNIITTGSMNPTNNDAKYNNNNLLIIKSKYLAENYENEFNELWDGEFGKGDAVENPVILLNNKKVENYFCPEDRCADNAIDLIKGSKKSIYFMAYSFTNEGIADELVLKNIDIKGIFDKTQASNQYSQYKRLKEFGLDVILDKNKKLMHHKVFIIDNETVITGSFNPTKSADERNDENVLIIHDKEIARRYLEEFKYVWNLE